MKRGKQTCKILKEIRRQIAEANDIEFITSECQYQGDCLGTCPKCEAEVRYLEQQLERKQVSGKAITVLGISAGLIAMTPMTSCTNSANKGMNKEVSSDTTSYGDLIMGEPAPHFSRRHHHCLHKRCATSSTTSANTRRCDRRRGSSRICFPDISDTSLSASDTLNIAPVMPEFPGGQQALMQFIAKEIQYPTIAQGEMGVGRVIIQFIVDKEGNVVNPKVVRSVDPYWTRKHYASSTKCPNGNPENWRMVLK